MAHANTTSSASIPRPCVLCGEHATAEVICDNCFSNAGDFMSRHGHLLAAAPDLLAACEAAFDQENECYSEGRDNVPPERCLHCILLDAIAKAKGRD